MKKLLPLLLIPVLALTACGQSAEKLTNQGNEAYTQQNYDEALQAYRQATEKDPDLAQAYYNAANALYRQNNYTDTLPLLQQALETWQEEDSTLPEHSLYNQGNAFFRTQELDKAIEAFKAALRLNPADKEAKENLELALLQKQQQNQDQQNQDKQNRNQQNQDQQNQDKQNQDKQDQQNQDQQNQGKQDQYQQNQDKQPDNKEQMTNDKGQMPKLTPRQARQLLQAAAQGTKSLEQFLQQIYSFSGPPPAEDW